MSFLGTRFLDLSERYPRRDPVLCKYTDNAVETRVAAEESQATASRVRRKLERDTKAGQIRDFNILSNSQQDAVRCPMFNNHHIIWLSLTHVFVYWWLLISWHLPSGHFVLIIDI